MPRSAFVALLLGLAACNPTFNWREIRAEGMGLHAMFPCKPDKGSRPVPMAGREVELHALGCDTGGATFAVLSAEVDPLRAGEVLAQWQKATLANFHGAASRESPFAPAGAFPWTQAQRVQASGTRPDGSKVDSQAVYFARGSRVFQAVVYAGRMPAEAADTFFAGLRLE